MGVEASYRRITPREWEGWQGLASAGGLPPGSELESAFLEFKYSEELLSSDRYLDIQKEWHALHALLTGDFSSPSEIKPFPPPLGNVVLGGTETPFNATYDKVRVLNPDEVRQVADALAVISAEDLKARFDPIAFPAAGIYSYPGPAEWYDEALEAVLFIYPQVVEFFGKAAQEGDVVLLSLD